MSAILITNYESTGLIDFIILFYLSFGLFVYSHKSTLSQYNNLFIIVYISITCSKACTTLPNVWEVDPWVNKDNIDYLHNRPTMEWFPPIN